MREYIKRYPVVVNPIYKHPLERRVDLGGEWNFRLDPEERGIEEKWYKNLYLAPDKIQVPGCWQGQGYGNSNDDYVRDFRYHVQVFKSTYKGTGWYGKIFGVPKDWKGLRIWLNFGGVNPTAEVWLNGEKIGCNHLPFVPFGFDITESVSFDHENIVVVRVSEKDRIMSLCYNWSGNWSGLYRTVELTAYDQVGLDEVRLYPNPETGEIEVKTKIIGEIPDKDKIEYKIKVTDISSPNKVTEEVFTLNSVNYDNEYFNFNIKMHEHKNWSPNLPNLYRVDSEIIFNDKICDAISHRTGFVKFTIEDKHIKINGTPYYMRGTGDFYEIPETGCPDTNRERWRKKLGNLRSYGYNYVRCQSYVPVPEYFDVADEVGLIVQSEMGILGGLGGHSKWHVYQWPQPTPDIYRLLMNQWNSIVLRDVNHPSANIYNMSNELIANLNKTEYPKIAWKAYYDTKKIKPFSMVIWTDGGYNIDLPGDFVNDDAKIDKKTDKPVIQHEYKWWSSFPDIRIVSKFSGAVRPYGIEIAYKNALEHNISHILVDAVLASQRLQYIEAKTKMERCRRDYPRLAGICHFNAMDLNASPQGIVDMFYDKKYADSNMWLQANGDTVVLSSLLFDDRVYKSGDTFSCKLYVSDFSTPCFKNPIINWKIKTGDKIIHQNEIRYEHKPYSTCTAGEVKFIVPEINKVLCASLEAELLEDGNHAFNKWDLWFIPTNKTTNFEGVYLYSNGIVDWLNTLNDILPDCCPHNLNNSNIIVTDKLTSELVDYAENGGRIFLVAGEGITRPFQFKWSFSEGARYYFSNAACYPTYEDGQHGTIVKDHPIFGDFPHENFADLQFFNMIAESPPIDLEAFDLNDFDPLMRMIHNYQVGRSLGQLIERKIGKGLIIICSLNLDQRRIEASYLFSNICEYMRIADYEKIKPISQKAIQNLLFAGTIIND